MKWNDITKEDVLGVLGLAMKPRPSTRVLSGVGLFGLGLLAGAGVALLLAPKPGAELRRDLGRKLGLEGDDQADGRSVDELVG